VHSDDDPICPIEDAKEIANKLQAKMVTLHGMKHFSASMDPRFTRFPELLDIVKESSSQ
jgi:predicted alpha/beta hydrolase family esterase